MGNQQGRGKGLKGANRATGKTVIPSDGGKQCQAVEGLSDWGLVSPAAPVSLVEASLDELLELQERILGEYPFLRDVYESVLVTDFTSPDNPIIFAHDNFEKMTMYPREEIIGKNCRFLQGRYTNKTTTRQIREAILAGQPVDVELLNYRKDGSPFWNRFLMLPVHAKHDARVVTHFIAIQKDVTYLRKSGSKPVLWSPVEIGLWCDAIGLSSVGMLLFEKGVLGRELLPIDSEDGLRNLGVSAASAGRLLEHLRKLRQGAEYQLYQTIDENPLKDSSQGLAAYVGIAGANDEQVARSDTAVIQKGLEVWNREKPHSTASFAIKAHHGPGHSAVFLCRKNISLATLESKLRQIWPELKAVRITHFHDGDEIEIGSTADLQAAALLTDGDTLHLYVSAAAEDGTPVSTGTA